MDGIDYTIGTEIPRLYPEPWTPSWAPLWVWDGDDSRWRSVGNDPRDGQWMIEATPEIVGGQPRLDIMMRQLTGGWINPNREQAMALRKILDDWIESLAVTGGVS